MLIKYLDELDYDEYRNLCVRQAREVTTYLTGKKLLYNLKTSHKKAAIEMLIKLHGFENGSDRLKEAFIIHEIIITSIIIQLLDTSNLVVRQTFFEEIIRSL